MRGHITGLGKAGYHKLPGIEAPDFVVMFVPVEPAFLMALQADGELWADAYKQGILLVGPTTLLYVIRIVNVLWQQERQARNVREVMDSDFRKRFKTVYGPLVARMDPTPGNHDWPNHATGYDPYWSKVKGRALPHHYAFSLAGWRIVSLNSETPGTITVRNASGAVIHDGTTLANNPIVAPTGALAVVFAPGSVVTRIGAASAQDRGCSGDAAATTCEQSGICSSVATARCNPINYLDVVDTATLPALSAPEDNTNFADSTTNNGFIAGPVRNAAGDIVLNDTLIVVRYTDLIPKVEQRVAREALACLRTYANGNGGHYPWAATVTDNYTAPLIDTAGTYFGRLPQSLPATAANGLASAWTSPCGLPGRSRRFRTSSASSSTAVTSEIVSPSRWKGASSMESRGPAGYASCGGLERVECGAVT